MKNITASFGTLYHPVKAFVIYEKEGRERGFYVESYDMDGNGLPINAHPLSVRESTALANALDATERSGRSFLKPAGLMPTNILYIDPSPNGHAVWYTPAQQADLLFVDVLGIPNGKAHIPALVWKASKESLAVHALKANTGLDEDTPLYHAPFFNTYQNGKVCMGTVNIEISPDCLLEGFMRQWEEYFFNSYFSHLMQEHLPVKGNIVQLWKNLVGTKKRFPERALLKTGLTIKNLIS
jgi:PRTRC genetic system protein B